MARAVKAPKKPTTSKKPNDRSKKAKKLSELEKCRETIRQLTESNQTKERLIGVMNEKYTNLEDVAQTLRETIALHRSIGKLQDDYIQLQEQRITQLEAEIEKEN